MKKQKYHANDLELFLLKKKIATMDELKAELRTNADMTVFRKLKELSYITSYSHGSRFYTLEKIAQFDEQGLWGYLCVWFSRYGTLLQTLETFVARSESGYYAHELEMRLRVGVRESLLRLVKKKRIAREKVAGLYLYCSPDPSVRRQQLFSRQVRESEAEGFSDEVKAAIVLFVSMLDEKQRRLFAGLESLKIGRGGDRRIAQLTRLHPHTVAKGRGELIARDVELERTRRAGAGRKPLEKKRRKSSRKSRS